MIAVIGLVALGWAAHSWRWTWIVVAVVALGLAVSGALDGRYDDSGGAVWYSMLVAALAVAWAGFGWGLAEIRRRLTARA